MIDLKSKVAIITGGGQGMGLGIAQVLARYGVNLVITGRSREKLDGVASGLQELGAQVLVVPGDISNRDSADATVRQTLDRFGRLDILVNNAQTFFPQTPLADYTDDIIHGSIDTGLKGTLYFMRAAYPALKARGGSVINVASATGTEGIVGSTAYSAAKEGVRGASRVVAREWGKDNIRVNVILPYVSTPAVIDYFERDPEYEKTLNAQLALGRLANPEEIGELVAFLCSSTCFLTGQSIHIDGGQVMP